MLFDFFWEVLDDLVDLNNYCRDEVTEILRKLRKITENKNEEE